MLLKDFFDFFVLLGIFLTKWPWNGSPGLILCALCAVFCAEPDFKCPGVGFRAKTPENRPKKTQKF